MADNDCGSGGVGFSTRFIGCFDGRYGSRGYTIVMVCYVTVYLFSVIIFEHKVYEEIDGVLMCFQLGKNT